MHDGHQGITRTRENAACSVWWPGISRDIERMVCECPIWKKYGKERTKPYKGTEFPQPPMVKGWCRLLPARRESLFFARGLISRDVEISAISKHVNTIDTILKMKKVFSTHGIPAILFSDNGPPVWLKRVSRLCSWLGIPAQRLIPKVSAIHGEVERAVQSMKMIIKSKN